MGLLEELLGSSAQTVSQQQASGLAQNVLEMLNESGGVQGLAPRFQQHGLGDVLASWVGTGANQSISAQQVINVLGPDRVAALAHRVGMQPDQASALLTQLLPVFIDKLTPNGQSPPPSSLMQIGLNLLKQLRQ